jgi:hypothetical protein
LAGGELEQIQFLLGDVSILSLTRELAVRIADAFTKPSLNTGSRAAVAVAA